MKRALAALAVTFALAPAGADAAEAFPSRPVRVVVGFTPGTTTDITARLLADRLTHRLGQNVLVENRPGANSGLANQLVSRATPDGHTLLIGTLSLVTGPLLYRDLPFDPKTLEPVSLLVLAANVICVYPGLPAKSLKELIGLARSQPGQLKYGSSGRGSSAFLTLELLKSLANIDMREIPYKATSQAVVDTMSGQIDVYPPNIVSAFPMLKTGKLRPLAVTSAKRSPAMPDLPAVGEFVPGYDATTGVYGILVPRTTPRSVIAQLEKAIMDVSKDPLYRDRLQADGAEVVGSSAREYAAYLDAQRKRWSALFNKLGIKPE
ncbi:MAG TPA: tripartite tricarboxylate transporter substrate-binding protein [Burkholderiales bacterium]|nr:tripartite tricarboxylate transporter substrate-binding protein [Burkholderiales bacterium]